MSITSNNTLSYINQTINFTSNVKGGVAPYSFKWDFGDGDIIYGPYSALHKYSNPASYIVKLLVNDSSEIPNSGQGNISISVIRGNLTNQTSGIPTNQTSGIPTNQTSGIPTNQTSGIPTNQTRVFLQTRHRVFLQTRHRVFLQTRHRVFLQTRHRVFLQTRHRVFLQTRHRVFLQTRHRVFLQTRHRVFLQTRHRVFLQTRHRVFLPQNQALLTIIQYPGTRLLLIHDYNWIKIIIQERMINIRVSSQTHPPRYSLLQLTKTTKI